MPRRFVLFLIVSTAIISFSPEYSHADDLSLYYQFARSVFAPEHLIPIVIPENEAVGNVYLEPGHNFQADVHRCFPKLRLPKAAKTIIPSITVNRSIDGGVVLGIPQALSANIEIGAIESAIVQFPGASIISVPSLSLADSFDRQKCPFLAAEIDSVLTDSSKVTSPFLVVGEVVSAQREVKLTFSDGGSAKAGLLNLKSFFKRFGLEASAQIDGDSTKSVVVSTTDVLPVAIRPAFVPDSFSGLQIAQQSSGTTIQPTTWKAVNLITNPSTGQPITEWAMVYKPASASLLPPPSTF
jgi:hypothetical protein